MRTAEPDEQSSSRNSKSTLMHAQDIEMRHTDPNGDGFIAPKQTRAEARLVAELRSSLSFWKKIALAILAFLFLSWIGNAGLTAAVVFLSKDLKVEGGALKEKNGNSISTLGQKTVYEATLGSGGTNENSTVVARVVCANVLLAISSIERGIDGSLVKIDLGFGKVYEPRANAATYELQDNSFGIEQIYLDDQRDVSYDVTCEISKEDCENAPESLCNAVKSSEVMYTERGSGTNAQRASDASSRSSAVAQVPCTNVLVAITSMKNDDAESLAKCLCDGNVWGAGMSGNDASYHLGDTSFDVEKIYMNDHVSQIYLNDVYYDVSCEFAKADCESAPDSVCDVVRSEDTKDRRALSFDEEFDAAFDGEPAERPFQRPARGLQDKCPSSSGR